MNTAATPNHQYQPTIIENRILIKRLVIQITFAGRELKQAWREFNEDPSAFASWLTRNTFQQLKQLIATPHRLAAATTAIVAVVCTAAIMLMVNGASHTTEDTLSEINEHAPELVMLDLAAPPPELGNKAGFGGSYSASRKTPGMGGGNRDPHPPQAGKLPPPSVIPAAIPITRPLNPPSLPVAGIDIDPTLWKDVEAPVYGDPNSKSQIPSSGPGDGGGIGTGDGVQIGPGSGFGTGEPCSPPLYEGGPPGCGGGPFTRVFKGSEVQQRPRILAKPEPQYTEEARKNQLTGTVMLRAVFSSSGEVVQIQALRTLPFGLTEQAIAAARRIKFIPAKNAGMPVSVSMQLEYNFNLY
jgi:TonB family protein